MIQKPNRFALPRYVALCGNPKAGKSLVMEIMAVNYGTQAVDDGRPLREIAKQYLGLTHDQVYTQEGKASHVEILGKHWQVREILGELGNLFEFLFGEHILPFMVTQTLEGPGPFVFGSVRKTQGRFYKQAGGIIIGIENPLAGPSPYAFDKFDESAVDYWIINDAQARGLDDIEGKLDLAAKIHNVVEAISRNQAAA